MTLFPSKVLITDDDPAMRFALESLLEAEGYQLSFAATGPECLAQAAAVLPDLILLDVLLPGLNGLAVCRQLRADPVLALVPVVLITAQEQRETRTRGLEAGADDFLSKPVDPAELLARVRTITRLSRYRRVLEEQAKFQQLVENTTDGVALYDEAGYVTEWNASLEEITGLSQAQALGRLIWDVQFQLLPPERQTPDTRRTTADTLHALLQSGLPTGPRRLVETEIQRPDGVRRVIESSAFAVRTAAGWRAGSVTRDITARRQIEMTLRESERSLKRSQQVAHVGHWTWQTRTNRVQWSDEMYRIFGVEPQTFDGELDDLIRRTIHPDDLERVFSLNAAVLRADQPQDAEYRVVWPDGSIRHIWASPGDRETDEQGNIVQLSGIVQDITARKQAEALQQEHLQTLMEMEVLRQVNVMRSELIANVSHEMRTPLGLISGLAAVLRSGEAPLPEPERQRFLLGIEEEAERLRGIVESLLDAEHLQAGRVILARQWLDLRTVVAAVIKRASQAAPQHRWAIELPEVPLEAPADARRIEQVLQNLVDNAIKYAPAGTIITVRGVKETEQIRLSVHDQGPGIPPSQQARIFERFYRLAEQNASTVPGLGLGLAICRSIVEMHGGQIWVESDGVAGRGSAFSFTLPVTALTQEG